MMAGDSISVIIPAYNAASFLGDALDCVRRQGIEVGEIIVVDDGSTDETPQVIAAHPAGPRYIRQQNLGAAAARNCGVRASSGRLIAFLDADDLWPAGTLRRLAGELGARPSTDILLGRVQYVRTEGAPDAEKPVCIGEPCVSLSFDAGLIRRAVFDRIGFLDEQLRSSEDIDWFMRARESGIAITVIDEVTLLYRRHGSNMTSDRQGSHSAFAAALKLSLDRRRSRQLAGSLPPLNAEQPKETGCETGRVKVE